MSTSAWVHFCGFSSFLDTDDIVQYLHLSRHDFAAEGRLREVYGFSDGEESLKDEHYPPSLFICNEWRWLGVSMRMMR